MLAQTLRNILKFSKLHEIIPYATGGKEKILEMHPYNAITIAMPGRHQNDTDPVGGDFVVMVDDADANWTKHQFTHTDLFLDLEEKRDGGPYLHNEPLRFLEHYYEVVAKDMDPEKIDTEPFEIMPGVHPKTFLYAVQTLAVAEHRRYAKYEVKFGGRYLPFRFAAGIVEGRWDAHDAIALQRRGRIGVEMLEKKHDMPDLTKELFI